MEGTTHDCCLKEQARLVARGVRPLALIGHFSAHPLTMLHTATKIEGCAETGSIPFVIDRGDGMADYGYAAAQWVLDLYAWVIRIPGNTVPSAQRHRIVRLLLGYSVESIRHHEEFIRGRRFHSPHELAGSGEPAASSPHLCSPNTGGTYPPG